MDPKPSNTHDNELTQQDREQFWKTHGWSPDLPDDERHKIETHWTDTDIQMARAILGY